MSGRFSIEARFTGSDGVSKVMDGIERRVSRSTSGLSASMKRMDEINGKIASGFVSLAKHAAVAGAVVGGLTAGAIYSVVSASNELGDSLGKVASIIEPMAGTVEDATGRVKAAALDWSSTHTASAKEFVDTSYQMLSAGLNEVQALAATRSAMTLATAAMGDNVQAGQLLATLYNNMGDKLKDPQKEFAHLADVVAQTQAVFQFSNFDALNQGLKYATPSALQFGVSLEQVSTALGLLNNKGLADSQAGTAWSASMSKMIKASHALGFAIAKTATGGVDFGATLMNIHTKLGPMAKMTDAAKQSMQKAFGEEGVRSIALLADSAEDFNAQLKKVSENSGVAARAQGVIEKAGSAPFKIMMQRWENAKVAMGDALTPVTAPLVERISGIVDVLGKWVDKNHELIGTKVQDFLKEVADSLPALVKWAERAGRAALVVGTFMLAVKAATGAIALFDFFAAANPWVLLAIALVTLTALLVAIWPELKKHQEIIEATAIVVGVLAVALKGQAMWTGIVAGVSAVATSATTLYAAALRAGAVAAGVMDAGLLPLLLTLGAIAVAIGAVYVALKKFTELLEVSGGWDGLKAGAGSLLKGDGLFAGIDAYQNAQAKAGNPGLKGTASATGPDPIAFMQSMLTAKASGGAPATPGLPALPPAVTGGLPPALAGTAPGQDPMANLNALLLQQAAAGVPGPSGARPAPQATSKDVAKDLGDTLGPALTEALKKGKGSITVTVKGGKGEIDQQPESGFELNMSPSGGF